MTTLELADSIRATMDSTGTATTAAFGPVQQMEMWVIKRYSVSAANSCKCKVYRNNIAVQNQIDVTTQGNGDTSSQGDIELAPGQKLIVQWTSGTPGDVCTFAYGGDRILEGDVGYHGL